MCGIAGWVNWEVDLTEYIDVVEVMGQTLIPRGPDAKGTWVSPNAVFAHRRLVVVDPAGGLQPMTKDYEGEEFVLVYNGELYNADDLRNVLQNKGHKFRSHSDTEVLLTSYIEWGPKCVDYLNGIFAFSVWRERDQSLFLARDRLGVKPLFYTQAGNSFVFASELKSILSHPAVEPIIDQVGLSEILTMGPARTPGVGIFKNVFELKPGHFMQLNREGVKQTQYWSLKSRPHEEDFAGTVTKVKNIFEDAVQRQLVSDVPLCTLLSGGLDSSAITAYAHHASVAKGMGPLHTFSVDYVDNDKNFKPNEFQPNTDEYYIKRVTEFLGSVSHTIKLKNENLIESLQKAAIARDLPGMADIDGSLMLFSHEIKKHATVALSGECADEVFGGYPWFRNLDQQQPNMFPWVRNLTDRMALYNDDITNTIKPHEYMANRYQEAMDEVPRLQGETGNNERMREMFYINLTRWMPTLLDRKDRMSMAEGLEIRVPFCDHRLVEYLWNVPWEMKYHNKIEKGLLRKALEGVLPDDVLYRKKSPYPKTHDPAYLIAMKDWVSDIIHNPSSPILPFINKKKVESLLDNVTPESNMPWFGQLMNLPQFLAYLGQLDTWMREYKVQIKLK
ncbi:asparagine synthase (glutamine-hydrolyzing) [Desulfuribacillus stibiiarsenatis]|uniref:asparagine synthase (glutamine-hydrolyzing) n=1 Tax=Desulfuribacillus stibiiarsenatis TaxID=1390249 RepID=A0A1E5L4E2_9FIRM|nr:asparagine synthase (glutamine-hydrolyzing) [Desulfuribacillus stibiiarsenatis]OEH84987.1 asparagine synthase (glutamine-hydrolyzing) [Desulfuribacillus stibiiarsenatis]